MLQECYTRMVNRVKQFGKDLKELASYDWMNMCDMAKWLLENWEVTGRVKGKFEEKDQEKCDLYRCAVRLYISDDVVIMVSWWATSFLIINT